MIIIPNYINDKSNKLILGGQYAGLSQANRNEMGFSSHMTKDYKTLLFGAPMFKNQGGFVQILHREDALENNYEAFQESQDL